ncbi:poly(U)-specific endoribonuclease homolog [Ooceraea biroi]|uniref:Poly(U)-specific endoribonuclease-like protein n=1 Tax=Ooceraea biroi TaxID=2015173 RepID=A0A026WQI2_OOCBI|nr:poly(U)-specific endoribonuclease homolog [Ooceraea biroi]EZA58193.1 Poly(U)-specific endoribonuclease-like protein [Ooceraea biroi]
MRIRTFLITVIVLLFIFADTDGRKSGGRSSSGSGSRRRTSNTRTTQRPRTTQGGSTPNRIGWNVPPNNNNKAPSSSNAKPSAPVSEHASKTSATNVQSGHPSGNPPPYSPSGYPSGNPPPYSPSGGYPRQPAGNTYSGAGYNQGYPSPNMNPSYPGYGGHSPYGQAYNPSMHHNAPPAYTPYGGGQSYGGFGHGGHQSYGQPSYAQPSYVQPAIAQAPALTVLQPSRPGIGQLAKEALVYSSVSAGVSAAVNRLLPGGIYGRSPGSGGGGGSHTEITYNNYYNNQSNPTGANGETSNNNGASSAAQPPVQPPPPAADKKVEANAPSNAGSTDNANSQLPPQNDNPSQPNYPISNDEVKKLSESLVEVDKNNAYKYITVNLQGETKEDSTTDDASLPLLDVKPEAYEIPTIKSVLALQDNYELDVKTKETVTSDERREESELLDKFMETEVLKAAMKFLADKGFIPNDEYEFKDTLKRIWFSQFRRVEGEPSSSGFEAVFVAEKLDSYMIGPQNWIYFAKQEAQKKLDYRGYIKDVKLGDKGEAIKIRTAFNIPDTKHAVTTLLVGLSPELEMALYTVCFYVRPNDVCPVSLAGKDVNLVSTRFNDFGKDILIAGFIAG